MYTFRAFYPINDKETSMEYSRGHVKVLADYGITNVTSNSNAWMDCKTMYGIVAEKEDGTMVGGIRVQQADNIHPLPVELAIGKIDPAIYDIVRSYLSEGVGELCALWNAKEVAGQGLSLLLARAGISLVNQMNCNILLGICAEYTMEMFNRVGFVVNGSLGNNGSFSYPNSNYIARVLGILNAKDLSTAFDIDRERMVNLRKYPEQEFFEDGAKDEKLHIKYQLKLSF